MVRVIPFLLILGALYWVAAPDPVTAGARTASGTAARAAGTGARSHWAAGRGQRQARRTKRRDGWWKAGGVRRAALRAEHAGVWSWGAGKTAAGVAAAAVRPVPSAVKTGWTDGRDRHRAKAGNRPAPVALDLPWWHREQVPLDYPPDTCSRCGRTGAEDEVFGGYYVPGDLRLCDSCVQWLDRRYPEGWPDDPAEVTEFGQGQRWPSTTVSPRIDPRTGRPVQPAEQPQVQGAGTGQEQVQVQPGDSPEVQPPHPSGMSPERRCQWCDDRAVTTKRGKLEVCSQCAADIDDQITMAQALHPSVGTRPVDPGAPTCANCGKPLTYHPRYATWYGVPVHGDPDAKWCPDCARNEVADPWVLPERLRCQRCGTRRRKYVYGGRRVCGTCADELDREQGAEPLNSGPTPADGTTAGTSPAANPTPTEGDPVSSPVSFELRNHVSVEGFAQHIDSMSENSDFILVAEKAAVMGDNLRGGGFGREMDTAVDGLGEDARAFAMAVANLRQSAHDWSGVSANVRGA